MTKATGINSVPDVIRSRMRKLRTWPSAPATPSATHDANIVDAYRRLLEREPNYDELVHWNVRLPSGASLEQLERSLKASYDYEQLRHRGDVVLVGQSSPTLVH